MYGLVMMQVCSKLYVLKLFDRKSPTKTERLPLEGRKRVLLIAATIFGRP
jgi:hypothetical protein